MAVTAFTRDSATAIPCANCETQFVPWQYAQKCCSDKCGYTHGNKRARAVINSIPRPVDKCVRCGDSISHLRRNAIYCSRSCKSMDYTFHKRGKSRFTTIARRRFLYERDGGHCYSCGSAVTQDFFELDHLIPVVDGGTSEESNLAVSCRWCNRSRGTKITDAVIRKIRELSE